MAKRKAKPKSRKAAAPAPSADEQALQAAVIAHPDEDTPRLMFADWLQENGQADHAEFIRAQIEALRLPAADPRAKGLRGRVAKLANKYRKQWAKGSGALRTAFVRGFVEGAEFDDLGAFCDRAEKVFAKYPLRVVYARSVFEESLDTIASCSHLARLTGLGSSPGTGWENESVAQVLSNP